MNCQVKIATLSLHTTPHSQGGSVLGKMDCRDPYPRSKEVTFSSQVKIKTTEPLALYVLILRPYLSLQTRSSLCINKIEYI